MNRSSRRNRATQLKRSTSGDVCVCAMCIAELEGGDVDQVARDLEREQDLRIAQHGFTVQYVQGDDDSPPWAYSIGRLRTNVSELVVVGLDPASSLGLISVVHQEWDHVINGKQPSGGGPEIRLIPIPRSVVESTDYLLGAVDYASRHGHRSPNAQQVIWADPSGAFPWEVDCSPRYRRLQPIIGFGNRQALQR
jgi:Domain of unknown function (DUF4262)